MNDSRDFQDAESVRRILTSPPVFFPSHRDPGGMLSRSGMPSRKMGRQPFGTTHCIFGSIFSVFNLLIARQPPTVLGVALVGVRSHLFVVVKSTVKPSQSLHSYDLARIQLIEKCAQLHDLVIVEIFHHHTVV